VRSVTRASRFKFLIRERTVVSRLGDDFHRIGDIDRVVS